MSVPVPLPAFIRSSSSGQLPGLEISICWEQARQTSCVLWLEPNRPKQGQITDSCDVYLAEVACGA